MNDDDAPKALKSFLAKAEPNLRRGCVAHVAAICADRPEGLLNLAATIILTPFTHVEGNHGPALARSNGLHAFRGIVPASNVRGLIKGVFAGRVEPTDLPEGIDRPLCFERGGAGQAVEVGEPRLLDLGEPENPVGLPAWVATGWGGSTNEIVPFQDWQAFERALPAGDPPFGSVQDLARHLFIQNYLSHGATTRVGLCAPYWLRLAGATPKVSEGKIDVDVQSAWKPPLEATLSLIPASPFHAAAKKILPLDPSTWTLTEQGEWTAWTTSIAVGSDLGPCRLSLNHG